MADELIAIEDAGVGAKDHRPRHTPGGSLRKCDEKFRPREEIIHCASATMIERFGQAADHMHRRSSFVRCAEAATFPSQMRFKLSSFHIGSPSLACGDARAPQRSPRHPPRRRQS